MLSNFVYLYVFQSKDHIHPKFRKDISSPNLIDLTLRSLDLLRFVELVIFLFPHLHDEVVFIMRVADQKQMLTIMNSNALDIKCGMKHPSS